MFACSIVTVKAEEGLPDMFTIVVDHDGEWLPRFLELEDLPALFKSQVYARDELSQPPEEAIPSSTFTKTCFTAMPITFTREPAGRKTARNL